MSSDSDDDIFGEKEEETENVTKKDEDKDIFGSESDNEQNVFICKIIVKS